VTPLVSDAFKRSFQTDNMEEKAQDFKRAGLLIPKTDLILGEVIGHGEFGGLENCGPLI
jgi:hypothetical protein